MNDILFGNSNRPVIKKLSNRYFKAGKSRNIIAIIAIALTTILFTTIFTLGSGLIDTVHDQNIRKQGGDGQAVLNYISDEVFDNIKGNEMIEQIAYTKAVSYHINNPGLEKWRADIRGKRSNNSETRTAHRLSAVSRRSKSECAPAKCVCCAHSA